MERLEKPKIAKINDKITHQDIGGKTIVIEREGTIAYVLDTPIDKMSIALYNFILRRLDILDNIDEDTKLYYGHIGNLGYFVSEDEISDIEEIEWNDARDYL